ncbi:MAG TPA: diacylglycerol kinase family protein [Ktedonobacterales bacterium]|jgi:diacylglycerol kinase family enzyme
MLTRAPRSAVLIASPRVQQDKHITRRVRELLQQRGIILDEVYPVATLDGKPSMAGRWQRAGVDLVIAAGGDGSIGCAATHVARSALPLGILPLGTSNDFARSLRLPLDLESACQTIAEGKVQAIDLGSAAPAVTTPYALNPGEAPRSKQVAAPTGGFQYAYFTHALTLGLNVAFARMATSETTRQLFGALTYPIAALGTLHTFQAMDFTLTFHSPACPLVREDGSDDELEPDHPYQFQALQVAVLNSPIFGGQFEFSLAGVQLDDHLLDILIVERFHPGQLVSGALTALAPPKDGWREARSSEFPGIHHIKAHGVTIETAEPADVTLDGEIRGRTPIHVVSAARALKVMVPAAALVPEAQKESSGTSSGS